MLMPPQPATTTARTPVRPAHSSSAKGRCSAGSDQKPVVRAQSGRFEDVRAEAVQDRGG
ncbi:hypothetical protein AB0P37_31095 [Streptomyces antimycoticus]|uniref:hypothetical protein n=1 Tax=Streptomyces antimycoticus TaxID=68175 RepID=UPI003449BC8D